LGKGKVHQKGFVSKLGTVLIIITILVGMLNILPAKASVGTIFIDPNGLIVPSTAPIRRDGNVYTLTADITSDMDGIYIGRNNVVLDGSSHTICGPMGYVGVGMGYQTNVTIRNMGISGFWYGLNLYGCREIKVVGNNITNMVNYGCAINALSAKNNTVQNNVISDTATGVWFSSSSDNTVSGNVFTDNTIAVRLDWSSGNSVLANNIAGNSQGIELEGSSGNSIVGNSIDGNGVGIRLVQSSGNTVTGNHITNQNVTGLVLNTSSKNLIYHNNFINSQQVSSYDSESVWDDGYPSGGNYWSEYNGTDLFSGPCQNETGNDGIGDTPYPVDSDSQDSFPVMNLWASTVCLYPFMAQTEEDATFTVNVMAFHVQDLWAWQTGLVWDPTALGTCPAHGESFNNSQETVVEALQKQTI
jgi:parallel beta-helix repeat protein